MEILLVDNNTSYLPELMEALEGHTVHKIAPAEIDPERDWEGVGAIILSGRRQGSHAERIQPVRQSLLVKNSQRPVLAICWGMQLLNYIYGGDGVEEMGFKRKGIMRIRKVVDDPLLQDLPDEFPAYESHRLRVKGLTPSLRILAQSDDGVEVVRDVVRPIYGVQFHPEIRFEDSQGFKVIENFLKLAA